MYVHKDGDASCCQEGSPGLGELGLFHADLRKLRRLGRA